MIKHKPRGTVSVFLCGVLMILIVFSCSIIDITRVQISQLQASRALQLASGSILASYDSQLQSQYGIFAKDFSSTDTIEDDLIRYVQSSLCQGASSDISNQSESTQNNFQLYDTTFELSSVSADHSLLEYDAIKLQILEYMKLRAPYIALEPFLDKLEMVSKASKTSEIIIQKNEVYAEIDALESKFYELEMLVEGIMVNGAYGTLITDSQGLPTLSGNYIKKMVTEDAFELPIYKDSEIPDESFRNILNQNVWYIDQTIYNYKAALNSCHDSLRHIVEGIRAVTLLKEQETLLYNKISELETKLNNLQESQSADISLMEQYQSEIDGQKIDLSLNAKELEDVNEELHYQAELFNQLDMDVYQRYLPELNQLIEPFEAKFLEEFGDEVAYAELETAYLDIWEDKNGKCGIKGLLEAALQQIETIQNDSQLVKEYISQFKQVLESDGNAYLEGTSKSIMDEMEKYENSLGIGKEDESNLINNVAMMKTTILSNLELINEVEPTIHELNLSRNAIYENWIEEFISFDEQEVFNELVNVLGEGGSAITTTNVENTDMGNTYQKVLEDLDYVEYKLDEYDRKLYFDYSSIPITMRDGITLDSLAHMVQDIFPNIEIPDMALMVNRESLPSSQMTAISEKEALSKPEISIEGSNDCMEVLKSLGQTITEKLTYIRDTLYINEYAIGMFQSGAEVIDQDLTLSQFDKSEHYLNYEVEYILFGNEMDYVNLMETVGVILAIRVALNTISLLLDAEKMSQINSLSTAIAGWWTLGIGSIIITAILTLIWATVESISDVQRLLNGEEVANIKTPTTWETDLLNSVSDIAEEVVEETLDNDDSTSDKSIIPELGYNGYLRLLLLSNIVGEETKLFRMMDLIQMNITKERSEEVDLTQYATSIQANGKFTVNYIFFNLPFMPDEVRDIGDKFEFELSVVDSY